MDPENEINDAFSKQRFESIWQLCIAGCIDRIQNRFEICRKVALSHFVLAEGLGFDGNEEDAWLMLCGQEFARKAIELSGKVQTVTNESYEEIIGLSILIDYVLTGDFEEAENKITETARKTKHKRVANPLWDFLLALILIDAGDIERAWDVAIRAKKSTGRANKIKNCEAEFAAIFYLLSLFGESSDSYSRKAFECVKKSCSPAEYPWLLFINGKHIEARIK